MSTVKITIEKWVELFNRFLDYEDQNISIECPNCKSGILQFSKLSEISSVKDYVMAYCENCGIHKEITMTKKKYEEEE